MRKRSLAIAVALPYGMSMSVMAQEDDQLRIEAYQVAGDDSSILWASDSEFCEMVTGDLPDARSFCESVLRGLQGRDIAVLPESARERLPYAATSDVPFPLALARPAVEPNATPARTAGPIDNSPVSTAPSGTASSTTVSSGVVHRTGASGSWSARAKPAPDASRWTSSCETRPTPWTGSR